MATAHGIWSSNLISGLIGLARKRSKESRKDDLLFKRARLHHYVFDVDHNGLDLNGFVLHADKRKAKREKFRVYLDSNENAKFDRNDLFFGTTALKDANSQDGVGGILGETEVGQLKVRFKKIKSKASLGSADAEEPDVIIKRLSFSDSDGASVAAVNPPPTFSAAKEIILNPTRINSSAPFQEEMTQWQKHCGEHVQRPPEDCFFPIV